MLRLVYGLLFLIVAATCDLALAQKGEELALFKKYYASARSTAERKEAVLTLDRVEDTGVFAVLYPKLVEKGVEDDVADAIVGVLAGLKSDASQKQVFDTLKSEKAEAGKSALLLVIARGKWKDRAGIVALQFADKSWEVRRHALDAVLACGDQGAAEKVVPLCDDPQDVVRFKALDTLASLASPLVLSKAILLLDDPSRQVRQSAIHALTVVRSTQAVEPLVQRMQKEQGVLLVDLGDALSGLTGREFGPEPVLWLGWWSELDKSNYEIPNVDAITFLRGHRSLKTGDGGWTYSETNPSGPVFPVRTPSRQIVFVIDCSGSMESLVTDRERFTGKDYADFTRMEIVKTELMHEIDRLPSYVNFNVIAFATEVNPWKPHLQQANVLVKFAAKDWVKGLHAIGGASKEDLAVYGLPGASNISKGKTNAFDALRVALGVGDVRTADATYAKVEADTVFFLSDGRPTVGAFVDPDDILREIKKLNELRKVVIHTIGIGEFDADFMRRLAEQNGPGRFTDLGK